MLKWKVSEEPSGRYRSFDKRDWPTAYYKDGSYAGQISCEDEYVPAKVREGNHSELIVVVADYSDNSRGTWTSKRLKARFKTLREAKIALQATLEKYPDMQPKGIQK